MRILISGGSGFIGTALSKSLLLQGHQVWILTRHLQTAHIAEGARGIGWDGRTLTGWEKIVSQVDAIVNLAGESLGSGLWTQSRKNRIGSSRVNAGKAISEAIHAANPRPQVLIQASAVGFYGPHGKELLTEESGPGDGFLADICKCWEESTQPVEDLGVRRVIIRTGVVLSKREGALQRMIFPFNFYIGGPLGNGNQGLPWIHPNDEVEGIRFLLEKYNAVGVFNLSAPTPISNSDFGRTLAKVMNRPFWLPVPAFSLRLLLGEMSTLVLEGQYMLPKRLLDLGFPFPFTNVEDALIDLVNKK